MHSVFVTNSIFTFLFCRVHERTQASGAGTQENLTRQEDAHQFRQQLHGDHQWQPWGAIWLPAEAYAQQQQSQLGRRRLQLAPWKENTSVPQVQLQLQLKLDCNL